MLDAKIESDVVLSLVNIPSLPSSLEIVLNLSLSLNLRCPTLVTFNLRAFLAAARPATIGTKSGDCFKLRLIGFESASSVFRSNLVLLTYSVLLEQLTFAPNFLAILM